MMPRAPDTIPRVVDLPPKRIALFLDFDGTLVDIAPAPDEVHVPDELRATLARLDRALGGAIAIVSGRDLTDLDGHLYPLSLAGAGGHGSSIRPRAGGGHAHHSPGFDIDALTERVRSFCEQHDGLICEPKKSGVAIHFRARPELADRCRQFAQSIVDDEPTLEVLKGKMVAEIKAAGVDKGKAVASLMKNPPFRGRRPVFIGDDVTDEAAFIEVNSRNGVSVKLGDGKTQARFRMSDRRILAEWLEALADAAENGRPS